MDQAAPGSTIAIASRFARRQLRRRRVALALDQIGRYVLVVNDKNVVERRGIKVGQTFGEMQVISEGLTGDERVVVNGLLRAIPGREVTPETQTATGQPAAAGRS